MAERVELRWEKTEVEPCAEYPLGATLVHATHDGPHVFVDQQCACGVLDLGVVR